MKPKDDKSLRIEFDLFNFVNVQDNSGTDVLIIRNDVSLLIPYSLFSINK